MRRVLLLIILCFVLVSCSETQISDDDISLEEADLDGLSEEQIDAVLAGTDKDKEALAGKGWNIDVRPRKILLGCSETDDGNDLPEHGTLSQIYRYEGSQQRFTRTRRDTCVDGQIKEYYCNGNRYSYPTTDCGEGEICTNGECVARQDCDCSDYESCVNGQCVRTCRDSDNGRNYLVAGQVQYQNSGYPDSCFTSEGYGSDEPLTTHVMERYCENGELVDELVSCEYGCYDGDGKGRCVVEGFDPNLPDSDGDGFIDNSVTLDNCPYNENPSQGDTDGDGIGDTCDICRYIATPHPGYHLDNDHDSVGDICDNCPELYNPFQEDDDNNGVGDLCE